MPPAGVRWWRPARALTVIGLSLFAVLLSLRSGDLRAEPHFSICTEDQPSLPLSNPDPAKPGSAQILIAMVAQNLQLNIRHVTTTWHNCQLQLQAGSVDAANIASYAGINKTIAVFPMRGAVADPDKSLGYIATTLFRRVGSNANLVNGQFVNLKAPVGIINSYQVNSVDIGRAGGIVDDNSYTVQSLARRLAAGKLDLAAADVSLAELVKREYAGKLEPLPTLLNNEPHYLVFSPAFYQNHRELVETIWTELARVRASPEFQSRLTAANAPTPAN